MFLHLGGNTLIKSSEVVAIINAENAMGATATKEFLKVAREEDFVAELEGGQFKSLVITDQKVYLSPISSLTLKKRAEFVDNLGI
jgi:hypothetical protein